MRTFGSTIACNGATELKTGFKKGIKSNQSFSAGQFK